MRKPAVLSIFLVLIFCLSVTSSAVAASDEEEAMKVMTNWFKALNTSDYELMSTVYWQSPKTTAFGPWNEVALLKHGWETIGGYWKSSLNVPAGTDVSTLDHPEVAVYGDDMAIVTGYNSFIYTDPSTKVQSTGIVRGTFVMQKINGKWKIVHEHSSVLPAE